MISIRNIASGAKTIAALIRGLRNGVIVPGSLLIIDEPEANLHPDWQVRFAEFLSLLNAKFGIRSLLNTHSPYFLKAIRVYSDLLGIDKKCSYYMMREDQSGYQYHTDDVSDDLESVFEVMSRPYARLIYGERYDNNMEKS
jgi:predicted ATPase